MRILEWRYRGWAGVRELHEGEEVLASVRWTWTRAEATIRSRALRVRWRGLWRTTLLLEDERGAPLATMPLTMAREQSAEVGGTAYRWRRPGWWRMEQILETAAGQRVARMVPEGFGSRVRVEVEDPSVPEDDLLPLLVLAIHAHDWWGASSASVVTSTVT